MPPCLETKPRKREGNWRKKKDLVMPAGRTAPMFSLEKKSKAEEKHRADGKKKELFL